MSKDFITTKKELEKTPKMSEREKFVYIFTSLAMNPVVMGLRQERKDHILKQFKDKFCPNMSNADWYILFHGCEDMRKELVNYLQQITTADEQLTIKSNFIKLVGDINYDDIANLARKVEDKLRKS